MPKARKQTVDPTQAGTYHCISRCVRRAWLCGYDEYLKKDFDYRKPWVENRIAELADIFACSILGYAVMSNHYHLVITMTPAPAKQWSEREVAERWLKLYPKDTPKKTEQAIQEIAADSSKVETYRARLHDLSCFMKMLNEPIARSANKEDQVNGKFWSQRFYSQTLQSEKSILAAMTYVDLNPVRAKIDGSVIDSKHTSVRKRSKAIRGDLKAAAQSLTPLLGGRSFNLPLLTEGEYIELVDYTGRLLHPGKRGRIDEKQPKALDKLGLNPNHWAHRVNGFGNDFGLRWFRIVGELEEMLEKAEQMGQRTLFGIGLARKLASR